MKRKRVLECLRVRVLDTVYNIHYTHARTVSYAYSILIHMDQSQPCIVRFTNLKCAQNQWTEEIDLEMEKSEKTHEKHKRNYNGIYRTEVYRANNTCTIKCIQILGERGRKRIRTGNWTKQKSMEERKSYNISDV